MKAPPTDHIIFGEANPLHGTPLSRSAAIPPALSEQFQSIERKALPNASLSRVIFYINQNYMHRLTLDIVAKHVFLNKTYISQLFSRHLDISFVDYLESVRIANACSLLRSTSMSVAEIAKAAGYSSASYFTKAFKKRIGVVPSQYRSAAPEDPAFPRQTTQERVASL